MNRYFVITLIVALLAGCVAAPGYRGDPMSNFNGKVFVNRTPMVKSPTDMIKLGWGSLTIAEKWPSWIEITQQEVPASDSGISVTYINHSTLLIQVDGLNILTDPIYSKRASPFQWAGPARVHAPGVAMEDLPDIDVILISHNHYDHLDEQTLRDLVSRQDKEPLILAGIGNGLLFDGLGLSNHRDLNWNDHHTMGDFIFTFTECRHRSGRGLVDQMKTLWGSFVIETPSGNIYFAGDTGYDVHFTDAGETFGEFELALLPIGAYEPRWFMADVHLNPDEAARAHKELNAKQSVGIHAGTFQLTYEAIDQPLEDLADALDEHDIAEDDFWVLAVGETRMLP
ncbi:MAG: MBL fold metallo-hydrolase [Pseudomonadales bacterium]|nr:MBL fold metallo-hydrolase [Pseudomonadales bacterium]MBO6594705.1 MBL fold metallo-hydrolase [Pseudomonadales bacterium]MBO6821736.1 MBL fold metallo-hydrolase [Pseudomonadales bacterium]